MLREVAKNVFTEARPLRFFGVETGTRMTVVRMANGGVFVHSPVALDDATKSAVDAIGPVRAIVCPSKFHHLYAAEWIRSYPDAVRCPCPGLDAKRPDVEWTSVLDDAPRPEWKADLDQVFFGARSLENEVVFFHKPTRTLICADFIFNLAKHPSLFTRVAVRMLGQREPGATLLERLMIRDRARARKEVDRILEWAPERIVLAHGDLVESGATEIVRRAYAWL